MTITVPIPLILIALLRQGLFGEFEEWIFSYGDTGTAGSLNIYLLEGNGRLLSSRSAPSPSAHNPDVATIPIWQPPSHGRQSCLHILLSVAHDNPIQQSIHHPIHRPHGC